jgi:hypothetical protein
MMDTLGIALRSYRRYVAEIHKDDKIAWLLTSRTQLEPELLKLKESFENTYDRALELSKDDSKYDVLMALSAKDEARANIVKLLVEGPQYVKQVEEALADVPKPTKKRRRVQGKPSGDTQEQATPKG